MTNSYETTQEHLKLNSLILTLHASPCLFLGSACKANIERIYMYYMRCHTYAYVYNEEVNIQ
jgi:hypothetical protein